jgi:hypothetical protein
MRGGGDGEWASSRRWSGGGEAGRCARFLKKIRTCDIGRAFTRLLVHVSVERQFLHVTVFADAHEAFAPVVVVVPEVLHDAEHKNTCPCSRMKRRRAVRSAQGLPVSIATRPPAPRTVRSSWRRRCLLRRRRNRTPAASPPTTTSRPLSQRGSGCRESARLPRIVSSRIEAGGRPQLRHRFLQLEALLQRPRTDATWCARAGTPRRRSRARAAPDSTRRTLVPKASLSTSGDFTISWYAKTCFIFSTPECTALAIDESAPSAADHVSSS